MRASRAALQAAKAAMSFGPPTAPSAALLAARDAPQRRVLLCANSTVHGGCVTAPRWECRMALSSLPPAGRTWATAASL